MDLQRDIKSSVSYLLLFLAFFNPDDKTQYFNYLDRVESDINNLESVIKTQDQKQELSKLVPSFNAFKSAGQGLLDIQEKSPYDFALKKHDVLSKSLIDSSFLIMDSASRVANIEILNYALGINVVATKIELTLASYYWGTYESKDKYFEELAELQEKISKYEDLSLKSQEKIQDVVDRMKRDYLQLDEKGGKIVELVLSGAERTPSDFEIIGPYVEATNLIMDSSRMLVEEDFLDKEIYFNDLKKLKLKLNIIRISSLIVFLTSFTWFMFLIFKKKK